VRGKRSDCKGLKMTTQVKKIKLMKLVLGKRKQQYPWAID
jgi:hypothetical protein